MILSGAISVFWGANSYPASSFMSDFRVVYYSTRCLFQHHDPYNEKELLRVYQKEGGDHASDPPAVRRAATMLIYLPTAFPFVAFFAMLPWGPAHILWMLITAAGLILASFLMWSLVDKRSPFIFLFLICIILSNFEALIVSGNSAGIAISLCLAAVWCFLKKRFIPIGILCLAVSLTVKPQDAGLVWLYFLLAGGIYRKRALQTLVLTIVLIFPTIIWVSHISPHWAQEIHTNLLVTSTHGDLNDPSVASKYGRTGLGAIINLQSIICIFRDDPRIYNPLSYLVGGALLLIWSIRTLKLRFSLTNAWMALAAIAALSMLPVYHRQHDAKLLLLTIPACAILWAEGGKIGRLALLITTFGIVLTADIPLALLSIIANSLHIRTVGIFNQILMVVLMRPASLILLVVGTFYLWVYVRRSIPDPAEKLKPK